MALFVIELNLAEQLQRSRDAARRVTEINRDIGVVMHNPVRRHECLRLAVAAGLVPCRGGEAVSEQADSHRRAFGPGSGTDGATRIVAQHLGAALKEPATTDNRPGASGAIAASAVGQSAPDGYTLLMGTNSRMRPLSGSQSERSDDGSGSEAEIQTETIPGRAKHTSINWFKLDSPPSPRRAAPLSPLSTPD